MLIQSKLRPALLALSLATAMDAAWALPCNSVPFDPAIRTEASTMIDVDRYVAEVATRFASSGNKGWAATLTRADGTMIASVTQGLARTACDPGGERAFTVDTETPWGSVSKLITTAAAIHAADAKNVDLDEPLIGYLPYRWRNQVHSRFALGENGSGPLTLRDMLQHVGGFRHSSCSGDNIKSRLLHGDLICSPDNPPPPPMGTRSYSNMVGIFQITLAYMTEPGLMAGSEAAAAGFSDAQYDEYIQDTTNHLYRSYVQGRILGPIGVTGVCNMAELKQANINGNYTLWFDGANDASGTLPHDQNHTCASGAWILSSAEMARFLQRLADGQSILSAESYALMESSSQDSHGWWRSDWQLGTTYTHNGAWSGTKSVVHKLPGGLIATAVFNSGAFDNWISSYEESYQVARLSAIRRANLVLVRL